MAIVWNINSGHHKFQRSVLYVATKCGSVASGSTEVYKNFLFIVVFHGDLKFVCSRASFALLQSRPGIDYTDWQDT